MRNNDRLLDMISELALKVSDLTYKVSEFQARVTALEFHKAVAAEPGDDKTDPRTEKVNRAFSEGLDAILSFDGRKKDGGEDVAED